MTWLLSRKTQLNLHDLTLEDADKIMLGKILIHLIHRETGLVNVVPNYVNKRKTINMLVPNPSALEWIEKLERHRENIATQYMPCVVTPRDWQEKTLGGGYYTSQLKGLRAIKLHKKTGYQDLDNDQLGDPDVSVQICLDYIFEYMDKHVFDIIKMFLMYIKSIFKHKYQEQFSNLGLI